MMLQKVADLHLPLKDNTELAVSVVVSHTVDLPQQLKRGPFRE